MPHNTKIAAHNPENRRSNIQNKNYINITDAAAIGGAFYSSGIKTPDALIGERQYRYRYPFNDTLIRYNNQHKLLKKGHFHNPTGFIGSSTGKHQKLLSPPYLLQASQPARQRTRSRAEAAVQAHRSCEASVSPGRTDAQPEVPRRGNNTSTRPTTLGMLKI